MPKDVTSTQSKPKKTAAKSANAKAPATAKAAAASSSGAGGSRTVKKATIDDIFASKVGSSTAPVSSSSAVPVADGKKKKKRKAATKDESASAAPTAATAAPSVVAGSRVQTVVDPSLGVGKKADAQPVASVSADEMASFRNSRGDGKSTGRQTEEGWAIYKEDALGIAPEESGGTPLCPFDCECCF